MHHHATGQVCRSILLVLAVAGSLLTVPGLPGTAAAAASVITGPIPEFEAEYDLHRNSLRAARLTRSLRCEGPVCRMASEGETTGLLDLLLRGEIEEWSTFSVDPDTGIQPLEYYYRQQLRGDNDEFTRLVFGASGGDGRRPVSNDGDEPWELQAPVGALDELSSQLLLMLAVRAGEERMRFQVVEKDGQVDDYEFQVTGTETVETGAGVFDAVRVERVRAGNTARRTVSWFAPELGYMPIIIQHERVGRETYSIELKRVNEALP